MLNVTLECYMVRPQALSHEVSAFIYILIDWLGGVILLKVTPDVT